MLWFRKKKKKIKKKEEKKTSLENLHFVSYCPIKNLPFNLICVLISSFFFQNAGSQLCFRFFCWLINQSPDSLTCNFFSLSKPVAASSWLLLRSSLVRLRIRLRQVGTRVSWLSLSLSSTRSSRDFIASGKEASVSRLWPRSSRSRCSR